MGDPVDLGLFVNQTTDLTLPDIQGVTLTRRPPARRHRAGLRDRDDQQPEPDIVADAQGNFDLYLAADPRSSSPHGHRPVPGDRQPDRLRGGDPDRGGTWNRDGPYVIRLQQRPHRAVSFGVPRLPRPADRPVRRNTITINPVHDRGQRADPVGARHTRRALAQVHLRALRRRLALHQLRDPGAGQRGRTSATPTTPAGVSSR